MDLAKEVTAKFIFMNEVWPDYKGQKSCISLHMTGIKKSISRLLSEYVGKVTVVNATPIF